eukprot:66930-Chlamydomonas_euryale.AAC.3
MPSYAGFGVVLVSYMQVHALLHLQARASLGSFLLLMHPLDTGMVAGRSDAGRKVVVAGPACIAGLEACPCGACALHPWSTWRLSAQVACPLAPCDPGA